MPADSRGLNLVTHSPATPVITQPDAHPFDRKVITRQARIAVIGLGYVGLPLALAYARDGCTVIGIDIDSPKVDALNAGRSHVDDVPSSALAEEIGAGRFSATDDGSMLRSADVDTIVVGTDRPYTEALASIDFYFHSLADLRKELATLLSGLEEAK